MKRRISKGFGKEMPPDRHHVAIYFMQKGFREIDAAAFIDHYEHKNWTSDNGSPVFNWKTAANDWIWLRFRKITY